MRLSVSIGMHIKTQVKEMRYQTSLSLERGITKVGHGRIKDSERVAVALAVQCEA